jgi:hypothetical protein
MNQRRHGQQVLSFGCVTNSQARRRQCMTTLKLVRGACFGQFETGQVVAQNVLGNGDLHLELGTLHALGWSWGLVRSNFIQLKNSLIE